MMNYWKPFGGRKKQGKGDEISLPNLGPCPNPFGQGNEFVIPMTVSKSKLVKGGGGIIGSPCETLPSFLMDSNVSLKWRQQKGKESGHALWLVALWG
jgi:hypothetical protein